MEKLYAKANEIFYAWEQNKYPNGDSPFSDEDRMMYVEGWVDGYMFLNSIGSEYL